MISRMRVWRSVVSVIGGLLGLVVVTDSAVAVGGLVSHFHYAFLVRHTLDRSESGGALSAGAIRHVPSWGVVLLWLAAGVIGRAGTSTSRRNHPGSWARQRASA